MKSSSTRRHHRHNPSPSPAGSSTSLQQVDHSQMNHVGPLQPPRRADSSTGSSLSVPDVGYRQRRRHQRESRGSLQWTVSGGVVDGPNQAEVDGERLDNAAPTEADGSRTDVPAEISEQPRLTARPSLRLRRHFNCPDLVIINRNPSAEDFATACSSPGDDAAPPPPAERALLPSLPSSSSASKPASRLPRRRLTMPGIIKYDPLDSTYRRPGSSRGSPVALAEPLPVEYVETVTAEASSDASTPADGVRPVEVGFGVRGGRPAAEMYVVENCARKRLQEEQISEVKVTAAVEGQETIDVAPTLDIPSLDGLDPPKPLTMRYRQVFSFTLVKH